MIERAQSYVCHLSRYYVAEAYTYIRESISPIAKREKRGFRDESARESRQKGKVELYNNG